MSAGAPVLASDLAAFRRVLDDGALRGAVPDRGPRGAGRGAAALLADPAAPRRAGRPAAGGPCAGTTGRSWPARSWPSTRRSGSARTGSGRPNRQPAARWRGLPSVTAVAGCAGSVPAWNADRLVGCRWRPADPRLVPVLLGLPAGPPAPPGRGRRAALDAQLVRRAEAALELATPGCSTRPAALLLAGGRLRVAGAGEQEPQRSADSAGCEEAENDLSRGACAPRSATLPTLAQLATPTRSRADAARRARPRPATGCSWPAGSTTTRSPTRSGCGASGWCAGSGWPAAPSCRRRSRSTTSRPRALPTRPRTDPAPDGCPAEAGWAEPVPGPRRPDAATRSASVRTLAVRFTVSVQQPVEESAGSPAPSDRAAGRATGRRRPGTGTARVKRGMAEMLKGGVIMDVVTAEQAKIAEDAGAVAVMALERVPADIRAQGGVARMSDPDMIDGIIDAVSIPVMAKARIGHFVEAQVLQSLGVDYVDESEVLTPADYANHIDKWELHRALRLRRDQPRRGAAPDHRGRGDDPLQGRGRHRRRLQRDHPHAQDPRRDPPPEPMPEDELYVAAKELQAPYELVNEVAAAGKLPVVLFTAGGIATPADAAMMMQLGAEGVFVGSGIFKSGQPGRARRGDRQGHHVLRRPRRHRQGLPRPRRGHGRHQRRRDPAAAPAGRARLVGPHARVRGARIARSGDRRSGGARPVGEVLAVARQHRAAGAGPPPARRRG